MIIDTKKAKEMYVPDEKAQETIWMHGCNVNQVNIIESLIKNKPDAEICCSKQNDGGSMPFQLMGLFIKGEVTLMSRSDIGSKYDPETGERYFPMQLSEEEANKVFVKEYEDLHVSTSGKAYTEAFVKPRQIVGVWVYGFAYNRNDGRSKILHKKCKILQEKGYSITVI